MGIVEKLSQAYYVDLRVNSRLQRLEALKALATKATTTFSAEPVTGTRDPHKMDKVIAKIVDLEREVNEDIDRLVELKLELRILIAEVPFRNCQLVLELRYLNFMKWHQVADSMGCSVRTVHNIHKKAIKFLEENGAEP